MYHPNGKLMCFCSEKRAYWYYDRGLARLDGKKLFLTFTPHGDGEPIEHILKKENKCVISGRTDKLSKHHIVPYCYRKHFPNEYKNSNSLDVVALNREVHNMYENEASKLKETLKSYLDVDYDEKNLAYSRCAAFVKNIIPNVDKIEPRIFVLKELEYINYINKYDFKDEDFNVRKNFDYECSKAVVDYFGIEFLTILWKLHFVKYGIPKYLDNWNPLEIKKINDKTVVYKYGLTTKEIKLLQELNLFDIYEVYV